MSHSRAAIVRARLAELLPDARFFGSRDVAVTACTTQASVARAGDVFVATVDEHGDSHEAAAEAVRRGAVAVVGERYLPLSCPQAIVDDSREALGEICHGLAGHPTERMCVVGVAGTHGKTVTSQLIASVFRAAGLQPASADCLAWRTPTRRRDSLTAAATPPIYAQWLSEASAELCGCAVVEAGARHQAARQLAGMSFDGAVLTNLRRRASGEAFRSLASYRRATLRITEQLKPGGYVVVNGDDPLAAEAAQALDAPVLRFGTSAEADVSAKVVSRERSEQVFYLELGGCTLPVRTRIVGDHHVENCLAAACVGLLHGIEPTTIVRGLEQVATVPGRLERLECGQDFGLYLDEAATPERLALALSLLRRNTAGRLICVLASDVLSDPGRRQRLGAVAERGADIRIVSSGRGGVDRPLDAAHDVLDGFERPSRALVSPNRDRAIQWAIEQARAGDSVLVAGAGVGGGLELDRQTLRRRLLGPPAPRADVLPIWLHRNSA